MKLRLIFCVLFFHLFTVAWAQPKLVKEVTLTNNNFDDRYASYSPDGISILFESNRDGNWNIFMMDANGQNQQRLTSSEGEDRRPSWHPSGKKILFESNRNGKFELYTIDLKKNKVKRLPKQPEEGELIFANYSPKGNFIAVSLKESEEKSNIIILKKNGKISRRITTSNWRSYYPKWSGDRKRLVYFSRKETENKDDEIYKYDLNLKSEERLTNWPKHNFCPSWSNDDNWIAFVQSMEELRPEIYVMKADGSNKIRITENEDGDTLPNWHPKENKLLITGYRNGNFEICELELKMK